MRYSTFLALLLCSLFAPNRLLAADPDGHEPHKAAERFIAAVRAGDADAIRDALAKPVDEEKLDAWVGELVKTGPAMSEERLRSESRGFAVGDFAAARGRFGSATYLRLMRQDDRWRVLAPGEPASTYGLSDADARLLTSVEAAATRSRPADGKMQPDPTAKSAPANLSPADDKTSAPARNAPPSANAHPAVREVLPLLLEQDLVSASGAADGRRMVEAVLTAGDHDAANQLLEAGYAKSDAMHLMPRVALSLPGGVTGAQAQALYAKHNARLDMVGIQEGIALAHVRAGNTREALITFKRLEEWGSGGSLLMKVLLLDPSDPYLQAFQTSRHLSKEDPLTAQAYALAALGRDDQLEGVLQEYAQLLEGKQFTAHKIENAVEAALYGRLRRGDLDGARPYIDAIFDRNIAAASDAHDPNQSAFAARSTKVEHLEALAAAAALRGDADAVTAAAADAADLPLAHLVSLPLAYVSARRGDIEAAYAQIDDAAQSPRERAWGLGMIARAALEAEQQDPAIQAAKAATKLMTENPSPPMQLQIARAFLDGVALGPEAITVGDTNFGGGWSFPLQ